MKTEKEIRNMLELCLKDLDALKAEYNKYIGTIYEDKYIPDICNDWDRCEAEIKALRWVLGIKP